MDGVFDFFMDILVFPGGVSALILGLLLKGLDRKAAARLQRRVGPPVIQPFYDLVKLAGKENCVPETARRFIFLNAPLAGTAAMALAMVLIPISGVYTPDAAFGDMLVLLYLLSVPAVVLMLSGSSCGSCFGALGFSREMSLMLAYEGPLLLALVSVALRAGSGTGSVMVFSLSEIVMVQQATGPFLFDPVMIPAFLTYMFFVPAALGVPPFDVAEAETEILEGPLLEYSGPALGMLNMMSALKMAVVSALGVTLFFPNTYWENGALCLIWFVLKCIVFTLVSVTCVRTATGRMRMDQAFLFYFTWPELTGIAGLLIVLLLG